MQKYLSRAGVASRRGAEELMAQGRVRVNGAVVTTPGRRIQPGEDRVEVDGRTVEPEPFRWVMLHKPPATVTTADDPRGRRTVYDLLPSELHGLSYVGRLDLDTEGLLLLSNEGDAIHGLLHPSFEVEREYRAGVEGEPRSGALERLVRGVELEDGPAAAREAERVGGEEGGAIVRVVLTEGRKREVRRLLAAVGHPVRWLRRVRFGPVALGDLAPGRWRELSDEEVAELRGRAGRSAG
ncbi:MAG: pseudouridine synthase [Gemmatimonadota bacterium]